MLQLVKTLLFDIPDAWKIVPYWAEPPRIGYFRGLPPPPSSPYVLRYALPNVDSRIIPKNTILGIGKGEKSYTRVTVK